jgi:autotransporter-associated beta strand protein
MAFPAGRFQVQNGGTLGVGVNGHGRFAADGVALDAARMHIGYGGNSTGLFSQSTGTVALAAESYVGADTGTGELIVTGGTFIVNADLRVAGNPNYATLGTTRVQTRGAVTVSNALLRCNTLNLTPWWPTDGTAKTIEAAQVNILDGATVEVNTFTKNDDPIATLRFGGGTLKARANHVTFLNAVQASGTLNVVADEGRFIAIDSQAYTVAVTNHPGTVAFTGPGGLKKLGSGALVYAPDRSEYTGDTVIDGGALRLAGSELIPHGAGAGDVRIASGAVLDLNGKSETVNRLVGDGRVLSTNAPATLGVLADSSDDIWERAWLGGSIALEKLGAGTLPLAAHQAAPSHLTVSDGTVRLVEPHDGYPYYRFKIEGVKGSAANSMQFGELALYSDGVNVTPLRSGIAYDPTGGVGTGVAVNAWPAAEPPEKVVDGITSSGKWLDFRASPTRSPEDNARVWLRIDFPAAQRITSYNWATANDSPDRDPAAWRLQGSFDGVGWTDLDVRTGYAAPATRNAWVESDGFPVSLLVTAPDIVNDAGSVTVRIGATLVLDDTAETVGGLVGDGTVVLSGSELTLAVAADAEAFFTGTLTGDGGLVKTGDGTQVLFGTNTYSGATVVQSGNLLIQSIQPYRWFRFTVKRNKANINVTQFAELALYSRDGQRQNQGLSIGAGVGALAPGQVASPAYAIGGTAETVEKLFDNTPGTKWCLSSNTPNPADSATWRTVVMRLADSTPEITSYNLMTANDTPERDPVNWVLEGSLDGQAWAVLDTREDVTPPSTGGGGAGNNVNTGRFVWYNDNVAYAPATRAVSLGSAERPSDVLPSGSAVEVRGGATLTVAANESIGTLRVDMLDAGTITRLIAERNGTLYIVNAGGQISGLVLPLIIGSVEGQANLGSWTVVIDGVPQSGVILSVDADGRLRLVAKGTILTVR